MGIINTLFRWNYKKDRFLGLTYNTNSIIGNKSARWIDLTDSKLWDVYNSVPHLNTVINRKATMLSNMKIRHFDKNGEEILESPVVSLLNNPNPLTDRDNFLKELSISYDVFANTFIYQNKVNTSNLPVSLWSLPPERMSIKLTGKSIDQLDKKDIIESYALSQDNNSGTIGGKGRIFENVDDIIHLKDNYNVNEAIGKSKLYALQMPISNLKAAYEARNILINERGAIGILSAESKDGIPMNPKEKELIEERLNTKYGITGDKNTKILATTALKWSPMNFDVKQLQLFEEVDDDFRAITDAFGMVTDIFSTQKGATFENQKEAMKSVYQNTIIPTGNMFLTELGVYLGLQEKGEYLKADYSHVPTLQDDKEKASKALRDRFEAMTKAYELVLNGGLDLDDYKKEFRL